LTRNTLLISLIISSILIAGGFYHITVSTCPKEIDNPPQILAVIVEKTHTDPSRIRKDNTFFFDFSIKVIDDHHITEAYVIIVDPNGNQTKINLVGVYGTYSDAFQAWYDGTYVFKFTVIDNANQKSFFMTNRTIVYSRPTC
jgi:hypothetical protein